MSDFIGRVRSALYPIYEAAPQNLKQPLRRLFRQASLYSPDAKSTWIRNTYTAFGYEQRKSIFMDIARFQHINRPIEGYYMEFGSHEANTMRLAWDCTRHLFNHTYIAFDSFQGLPDISAIDEQEIWEKGKLATAEAEFRSICERHGIPADRLRTVAGFYDQSLTPELAASLLPTKAAVIYVDCDLYLSTVPVLRFIPPFLQPGCVIVFDDWNCFHGDPDKGERRAWAEFRAENPTLEFVDFVQTGMQKAFIFTKDRSSEG